MTLTGFYFKRIILVVLWVIYFREVDSRVETAVRRLFK